MKKINRIPVKPVAVIFSVVSLTAVAAIAVFALVSLFTGEGGLLPHEYEQLRTVLKYGYISLLVSVGGTLLIDIAERQTVRSENPRPPR